MQWAGGQRRNGKSNMNLSFCSTATSIDVVAYEKALRAQFEVLCRDRVLQSLHKNAKTSLCFSATEWGSLFAETENRILFVGKANNGAFRPLQSQLRVEDLFGRNAIFNPSSGLTWNASNWNLTESGHGGDWRPSRSPFFRVLRGVAEGLYGKEWDRRVAYGNFCKCNVEINSSPDARVYENCREIFANLFKIDLQYLNPKFVICFTGSGDDNAKRQTLWFSKKFLPFVGELPNANVRWGDYCVRVFEVAGRYYLISEHPQGKPETLHVETLLKVIRSL